MQGFKGKQNGRRIFSLYLASAVKFLSIFAVTQVPLAIIEGILSVVVVIGLETYAKPELEAISFTGGEK